MAALDNSQLSPDELFSLKEIGKSFLHKHIPDAHAEHLLELRLIYRLLGTYRITGAGKELLATIRDE